MKYHSVSYIEFSVETNRDDFDIKNIGLILDLNPTHYHQKGDKLEYTSCAVSSLWRYRLKETLSFELDGSIEELLSLLSEKKKELALIRAEDMDCMISIVSYKARDEDVGLDLDVSTIEKLSQLGLSLHYNVYDKQVS